MVWSCPPRNFAFSNFYLPGISGIEGAFYEPGSKTVIPRKVCKFETSFIKRWRTTIITGRERQFKFELLPPPLIFFKRKAVVLAEGDGKTHYHCPLCNDWWQVGDPDALYLSFVIWLRCVFVFDVIGFAFQVIGKFSIRLVPDMTPEEVDETVCNYIKKLHEQRGSPNPLS